MARLARAPAHGDARAPRVVTRAKSSRRRCTRASTSSASPRRALWSTRSARTEGGEGLTMPTVRRRRRDSLAERRAETKTSAGSSASSSSRARVQFRKLGANNARVRPTDRHDGHLRDARAEHLHPGHPQRSQQGGGAGAGRQGVGEHPQKVQEDQGHDRLRQEEVRPLGAPDASRASRKLIARAWRRGPALLCRDPRARSIERASGERTKISLSPLKPRATTSPSESPTPDTSSPRSFPLRPPPGTCGSFCTFSCSGTRWILAT